MNKNNKKLKKRNWFKIYECGALKEYLENFASQGYRLESMTNNIMVFVPWEGGKLFYDVNIFIPSKDAANKKQQREEFIGICEDSGWEFVCEEQNLYIFCSETPDLIPVETDEEAKFRNIHKRMLSENVFTWLLLPLMGIFILWAQLRDAIFAMTNYVGIFIICIWPFLILNALLEIGGYIHWYIKSKKSLLEHGKVSYRDGAYHRICHRILLAFPFLCLLAFIAASISNRDWLLAIGYSFLLIFIVVSTKTAAIASHTAKKIQDTCCIVIILVAFALIFLSFFHFQNDIGKKDLAITMEDCGMSVGDAKRTFDYYLDKTVFASLESASDELGDSNNETDTNGLTITIEDADDYRKNLGVYYEIFRSSFPSFVEIYVNKKWLADTKDPDADTQIAEIENDAWNAKNVYEITWKEDGGQAYLVVYEHTALEIEILDKSSDGTLSDDVIKNIVKNVNP